MTGIDPQEIRVGKFLDMTVGHYLILHQRCKTELDEYNNELMTDFQLGFTHPERLHSLIRRWENKLSAHLKAERFRKLNIEIPEGLTVDDLDDDGYPLYHEHRTRLDRHRPYEKVNDLEMVAEANEKIPQEAKSREFITMASHRVKFGNCSNLNCRRIGPLPHHCGVCNDNDSYFYTYYLKNGYANTGLNPKFVAGGSEESKVITECHHQPVRRLRTDGKLMDSLLLGIMLRKSGFDKAEAKRKSYDLFAKAELYWSVQQGKRSLEDIQAELAQRDD